jgi:hypothetical protein
MFLWILSFAKEKSEHYPIHFLGLNLWHIILTSDSFPIENKAPDSLLRIFSLTLLHFFPLWSCIKCSCPWGFCPWSFYIFSLFFSFWGWPLSFSGLYPLLVFLMTVLFLLNVDCLVDASARLNYKYFKLNTSQVGLKFSPKFVVPVFCVVNVAVSICFPEIT